MAYRRANYQRECPHLVDQRQDNRRARNVWRVPEAVREAWVRELGAWADKQLLLDTKPVPVVGYTRSKRHSGCAGYAS